MIETERKLVRSPAEVDAPATKSLELREVARKAASLELSLLEAIDDTLAGLLGRRAKEAIYDHLERYSYISRDDIPERLDDFCKLLEASFGKGGKTIERAIAKRLYSQLGKEFAEVPGFGLADYLEKVRLPSTIDIPIATTTITASYCY